MLAIAVIELPIQTLEQAITLRILIIRVQEDLQATTLTTDHLTLVLVTTAQEVQAQTVLHRVIPTHVLHQVGHRATLIAHLAMIEVLQTILLLVEVLLALQVVLARVQVVLVLVQEEAVVVLAQAALQEDPDNF